VVARDIESILLEEACIEQQVKNLVEWNAQP
jgi:hypothetical protein